MKTRKLCSKEIKQMLGLDELSPRELAKIQGGETKCKCKCNCDGEEEPEEIDIDV